MVNLKTKYSSLVDQIKSISPFKPDIALILGSGLGDFAQRVETIKSIGTSELNGFPKSTVHGHEGKIHFAKYKNKNLLIFQGRIHLYEGYKISECLVPVHIASELGVQNLLLTNAAGGINPNFKPGDLMLITNFYSFNIKKELSSVLGLPSVELRNSFLDFPSKLLNDKLKAASLDENVFLQQGAYWFGKGPSYETPAEIQMLSKFGIDAVGMSTVHEAFYAKRQGINVAAVSCITNYAAGISPVKLTHKEVMETAEKVKDPFERLVKKFVELI